jgi:signal transduction histidine kinase/CheY-like chemotaxis protein
MVGHGNHAYSLCLYGEIRPIMADALLDRAGLLAGSTATERVTARSHQSFFPLLRQGKGAWLDKTASLLLNEEGRVTGAIETIRDITDQKNLETQLAQAQRLESLGNLAGGIAHDFNNILAAIGGYSELAQSRRPSEQLAADLRGISQAVTRAADLVRQILAFSRVRPDAPQVLEPIPLVEEALRMLRATLPSTVIIEARLECRRCTLADPAEIHRLVVNLCTNAAKAMRGHGLLDVRLEDLQPDQELLACVSGLRPVPYVALSIRDNGHGMSAEVLDRIFDPFFTTQGAGGTGMGLAVVHGIVQARGGAIRVESSPNRGSLFQIFLPATELRPEPAKAAAQPDDARGMGRVLVVDDEAALVDILSLGLGRAGFEVKGFTSSVQAMEHFRANPGLYDLLVTDLTMPTLTGADLAAACKALQPALRVILCTGYDKESSGVHRNAVDLVLPKPTTLAEMRRQVSALLAKASAAPA